MLFSNLVGQEGTGQVQPPEVNLISAKECNDKPDLYSSQNI